MNIKKVFIILICVFASIGCTIQNISDSDIDKNLDVILNKNIKNSNKEEIGYQYYLPSYISTRNVKDFNQELYSNGNTYYLYVDIVSYYHKIKNNYKIDKNAYISKKLDYNSKTGYLEVNEVKGKYYIEMMFNYAKVEAYVSKYDLVDSISSMAYVLSSIKYNKNTIEAMLGSGKYDLGENETYNIFETKKTTDGNFLDWVNEYDTYNGDNSSLESLIEQDEITSTDE